MEQTQSPRTTAILNLYKQGHSPARIGQIVSLAESRVLFTLDQFGELSPEDSEVWAERRRLAHEVPAQAPKRAAATPYTEPAGSVNEPDRHDLLVDYLVPHSERQKRLEELERSCIRASARRRFGDGVEPSPEPHASSSYFDGTSQSIRRN